MKLKNTSFVPVVVVAGLAVAALSAGCAADAQSTDPAPVSQQLEERGFHVDPTHAATSYTTNGQHLTFTYYADGTKLGVAVKDQESGAERGDIVDPKSHDVEPLIPYDFTPAKQNAGDLSPKNAYTDCANYIYNDCMNTLGCSSFWSALNPVCDVGGVACGEAGVVVCAL